MNADKMVSGYPSVGPRHLRFRQAQAARQLLPLGPHNVVVLLEGSLQTQELGRREGGPDAFGLPGKRTVEEQAVLGHVVTWRRRRAVKVTTRRLLVCDLNKTKQKKNPSGYSN